MKTHAYHESTDFTKCETFGPEDEFAAEGAEITCIECRFFDRAQAEWEKYVSQPVNFGEPDVWAEHDAFFAGYFAAIKEVVPF